MTKWWESVKHRKKGINFVLAVNVGLFMLVFVVCITPSSSVEQIIFGKIKTKSVFPFLTPFIPRVVFKTFSILVHMKQFNAAMVVAMDCWWFYTFNGIDSKWMFNKNEIGILEIVHFADDLVVTVFLCKHTLSLYHTTFRRRLQFVYALFIFARATAATWHCPWCDFYKQWITVTYSRSKCSG